MKKTIATMLMGFTAGVIILSGCSGGGSKTDASKSEVGLIGKWEITEAQGTMADVNKGTVYEFVDATNMTLTKGMSTKATYKMSGDTLLYSFGQGMDMKAIVKINGSKMNFDMLNSDQKFVLDKK